MNELKLLRGKPIEIVEGLYSYPLTINEIDEMDEDMYNSLLSILTITKSKAEMILPDMTKEEIYSCKSELELILSLSIKDPVIFSTFIFALNTFLKVEITNEENVELLLKNDKDTFVLDDELFKLIRKVIMKQNYLKEEKEIEYKPVNSKAQELLEKLKKEKAKIQKQNSDNGLSLSGIVSIVATYSNAVNIFTVWDLTIYQLYELYLRIVVWDNYHTNFLLIPHVSDSTSLDLKHWGIDINKINNNN